MQPADCEQIDLSSLVLGKASFADFDPLINSFFRLTDSSLWVEITNPKLGKAILHIAKGWPVSPVLLSVHEDGGFHFGDGTHRYEVLKRSGTPHFYFLAMPDDVSAINQQLTFQWMSDLRIASAWHVWLCGKQVGRASCPAENGNGSRSAFSVL